MKPQTIARNRKSYIDKIFQNAVNPRVYNLDNCFIGSDVSIDVIKADLYAFYRTRLRMVSIDAQYGHFSIHIHSNLFYHFDVPLEFVKF